jgi:hypothetical protein
MNNVAVDLMNACADGTYVVGTNMFANFLPPDRELANRSFIGFYMVKGGHYERTIGGHSAMQCERCVVECKGTTEASARSLSDTILSKLDNKQGFQVPAVINPYVTTEYTKYFCIFATEPAVYLGLDKNGKHVYEILFEVIRDKFPLTPSDPTDYNTLVVTLAGYTAANGTYSAIDPENPLNGFQKQNGDQLLQIVPLISGETELPFAWQIQDNSDGLYSVYTMWDDGTDPTGTPTDWFIWEDAADIGTEPLPNVAYGTLA